MLQMEWAVVGVAARRFQKKLRVEGTEPGKLKLESRVRTCPLSSMRFENAPLSTTLGVRYEPLARRPPSVTTAAGMP